MPARTAVLVLAVLGIQLGFIGSYVGAFHSPTPHKVPVAVVAPTAMATGIVDQLDELPGHPLIARAVPSEAQARRLIGTEAVDGALVFGTTSDRLLIASADGGAMSEAVTEVGEAFTAAAHQRLTVTDVLPSNRGDARGLSAFYLAVGWSVGGYLVASLLAVSIGARPRDRRQAFARLAVLAVYAVLSGVGGAMLVGSINALPGNAVALSTLGALLVFAVGAFSVALEAYAGVYGIGLVIVLLVVLGNPSAGGAYPAPLLPTFWRVIGQWLPPGAGTTAVRTIVYFKAAGVLHQVLTLAGYAVAGTAATLVLPTSRRTRWTQQVAVVKAEAAPTSAQPAVVALNA